MSKSSPGSPDLMSQAVAGGAAAFKVNCVQCHGSGAAGSAGYPNLNDDDWLWGGSLPAIHQTILHGIRQPGDDQTRTSQMPAFGDILEPKQISDVAGYVHEPERQGRARMLPGPRSSRTIALYATAPTARGCASSARPTWPTRSGFMAGPSRT